MRKGVSLGQKGHYICPACFDPRHPHTDWKHRPRKEGVLVGGNIGTKEGPQTDRVTASYRELYYPFTETTGSVAHDYSGHGIKGSLTNFPTDDTQWNGSSLLFSRTSNSSGNFVDCKTAFDNVLKDNWSVSFQILPTDGQTAYAEFVFGSYLSATRQVGGFLGSSTTFDVYYAPNGTKVYWQSAAAFLSNGAQSAFTHVVITATSGESIRVYKNGSIVAADSTNDGDLSDSTMSDYNCSYPLAIGAIGGLNGTHYYPFDGRIKNFQIYNAALSASQVSTLYSEES